MIESLLLDLLIFLMGVLVGMEIVAYMRNRP